MSSTGFRSVVWFEISRTLRRPQFWIAAIMMPILLGTIWAAVAWSSAATPDNSSTKPVTFEYVAPAGLISAGVAAAQGGTPAEDQRSAITRVENGSLDALLVYERSGSAHTVEIYAQDRGVFRNGSYQALAREVFDRSVDTRVAPNVARDIRNGVSTHVVAYDHGRPAQGLGAMIAPGFLVIILVLVISLLGNQMLNATVEEKENRISEMLLVSITSRTLIQAKIASLAVLGLVQICVVGIPSLVLLSMSGLGDTFNGLTVGPLQFDPIRMTFGILILIGGLGLITSALVLLGALMPSAKDAAPFYAVVVLATIAPLYLVTSVLINPNSTVATAMSFIPNFAAATALMRNAAGGLGIWQATAVTAELFLLSAVLFGLAVRIFQRGAIQYGTRVPILASLHNRARTRA